MSTVLAGWGTWLPERVQTNDAWPESFGKATQSGGDRTFNDIPSSDDPLSAAISARHLALEANDPFLGAVQRRVADASMTAVEAEALAARAALADAGVSGADVDLVLSHSVMPDRVAPSAATSVARHVGAERARAFGVDAACASAVVQLEVARAYLESGLARVVLATQSHVMMRAFPRLHPAAPGLGDGATAMVLTTGERGLVMRGSFSVTHGEHALSVTYVRGSDEHSDLPWWQAGGDFRMGTRAPAGAKFLMRETVSFGAATVREAATRAGIDVERIDVLASVQPRGFMPGAIAERLGLPYERAVTTYGQIAHVGVCGPLFNLERARKLGRLQPGAIVALYAQGAGFTRSAALFEWRDETALRT